MHVLASLTPQSFYYFESFVDAQSFKSPVCPNVFRTLFCHMDISTSNSFIYGESASFQNMTKGITLPVTIQIVEKIKAIQSVDRIP